MAGADTNAKSPPWKIETGLQMLARLGVTRTNLHLESKLFPLGLTPGSIMEVYGDEGSGKSEFLLTVISRCIMPIEWQTIPTEGLGIGVIYVDTDQHLNIKRLESIVKKRLQRCVAAMSLSKKTNLHTRELQDQVKMCLKNFRYASCYRSSMRLMSTLHAIRKMVVNNCSLCLVIIDSLSAFYWEDRMMRNSSGNSMEKYYSYLADLIGKIVRSRVSVIFTTQPLMSEKRCGVSTFYFMGQEIKKLLNFRLKMTREQNGSNGHVLLEDVGKQSQTTTGFVFTEIGIVLT